LEQAHDDGRRRGQKKPGGETGSPPGLSFGLRLRKKSGSSSERRADYFFPPFFALLFLLAAFFLGAALDDPDFLEDEPLFFAGIVNPPFQSAGAVRCEQLCE
jgi:hypothetical protein